MDCARMFSNVHSIQLAYFGTLIEEKGHLRLEGALSGLPDNRTTEMEFLDSISMHLPSLLDPSPHLKVLELHGKCYDSGLLEGRRWRNLRQSLMLQTQLASHAKGLVTLKLNDILQVVRNYHGFLEPLE